MSEERRMYKPETDEEQRALVVSAPPDETALITETSRAITRRLELNREQVELVKRTIARDTTDDELKLFLAFIRRTGLDPFVRQCYAIKRWDAKAQREVMAIQVGIDGYRLTAERTSKYGGQLPTMWCGPDGQWVDAWIAETPPVAAKVSIIRTDWQQPITAVVTYREYVQTNRDGKPNAMWAKMPANQLAKCGEAQAIRKAFPQETAGFDMVGVANNGTEDAGNVIDAETGEITGQTEPPTGKTNGNDQVADNAAKFEAFLARVKQEIPYYNGAPHIKNTLKQLGYTAYNPDSESAMLEALQKHATQRANEKAQAEGKPEQPELPTS